MALGSELGAGGWLLVGLKGAPFDLNGGDAEHPAPSLGPCHGLGCRGHSADEKAELREATLGFTAVWTGPGVRV